MPDGQYGDCKFTSGTTRVLLSDGDSVTITNLPGNLNYSISELTEDDTFEVTYENVTGGLVVDRTVYSKVVNTIFLKNS